MKKISIIIVTLFVLCGAFSQTVTLKFTGRDANNNWVQLDSVTASNLTRGWTETLYWPDTVLTMQVTTGIDDAPVETFHGTSLQLEQNNPNPFSGTTNVTLTTVDDGAVTLAVMDMNGRTVAAFVETMCTSSLQSGTHQFRITVANAGTYILVARQNGHAAAIKMVSNGGGADNRIEYTGTVTATPIVVKPHGRAAQQNGRAPLQNGRAYQQNGQTTKFPKLATTNPFQYGDIMEYTGYATINDEYAESERIVQMQGSSQTLELEFDVISSDDDDNNSGYIPWDSTGLNPNDAKPCYSIPTVMDIDSNVYNTVQIGTQCWMRENLRTTHYADNTPIGQGSTTSTTVAYWYYPDNNSSNKATYGLLYNWKAVMRNSSSSNANPSGIQGICPTGWHVPSDAEWTQLTDYVSSQSQYVCGSTSTYIAKSLASTTGGASTSTNTCAVGNIPSSNNATGFSALPAGHYADNYDSFGANAWFWSSTEGNSTQAYARALYYYRAYVRRYDDCENHAFSVRCLRD